MVCIETVYSLEMCGWTTAYGLRSFVLILLHKVPFQCIMCNRVTEGHRTYNMHVTLRTLLNALY